MARDITEGRSGLLTNTATDGLVLSNAYSPIGIGTGTFWQNTGIQYDFAVVYVITGKGSLATLIAFWETVVKVGVYYWHERVWDKISWGRA